MKSQLMSPARIARSLVTVLVVVLLEVVVGPIVAPHTSTPYSQAATFNSAGLFLNWDVSNSSSYSGSGSTVINDLSGNGLNSTVTQVGGSAVPAYTGTAPTYLTFTGSSTTYSHFKTPNVKSYLDQTSAATLQNISIFTWVYPTGNGVIIDEVNADNGWQDSQIEMVDGAFNFRVWNSSTIVSDTTTPLNYWYYVGFVYDFSNLRLTAFVNGQQVGVINNYDRMTPWETNANYTIQYSLGRYDGTNLGSASAGNFRFGALHLFKTALSQSAILNNYEAGLTRFGPTISNPVDASTLVNRSSTFSVSACSGVKSGSDCAYRWEVSTDNGSTWNPVGNTTTSYTTPILTAEYTGRKYRMYAADPGSASNVPQFIRNYSISAVATLTVSIPPGSDTDTALTTTTLTASANQYASVASSSEIVATNALTVEAWVYPTSFNVGNWSMVVNKENSFELGVAGSSTTSTGTWYYGIKGSGGWSGVDTGIPAKVNEWHHIAITRAASTNSVDFYLDGVKVYTGTADGAGTGNITDSGNPLAIGARWNDGSGYIAQFKGQIDQVMIFGSQRSASEVLSDMNNYTISNSSSLMAHYDFNEGFGTTIYNRKVGATSASDLTISGSISWSDIKQTTISNPYTVVKFPRTYLTMNGGWRVPSSITKVSAVVVAGGGGGGSRAAGGGGAGGYVYIPVLSLSANAIETITIGQGGLGGIALPAAYSHQGADGQNSRLGNRYVTVGGGGGGGAGEAGNTYRVGRDGGSGGGASGDAAGNLSSAAYGLSTQYSTYGYGLGYRGGSGVGGTYWNGGGGGGAGGAGSHSSTSSWAAGDGGPGVLDPISNSNKCLAAGGGGGTINGGVSAGAGGSCAGGTSTAGAGTVGSVIGNSAQANSGSGGGGSGYSASAHMPGGNGGSGVIIIRWITALKPTFTPPSNAYLNVGMTETFTVNVASDSATVGLTRTFRWESTTGGSGGSYSLIKQGTGAANAYFAWVPTDISTSGANFLYRVIVTDSDTAGLFIVETSTAVYAVINRALVVSGTTGIAKTINIAKSETFTITFGTSTYRPVLSPTIPGITLDTSTAGVAVVKISETMTVGTYYETLTVTDSVSAQVITPLTIVVAAPPNLINSGEIISNNLKLHLEAGNSGSILLGDSMTATSVAWKDLSGNKKDALTSGTFESGGYAKTCAAPQYSSYFGGYLKFNGSNTCYMTPYLDEQFDLNLSVEVWVRVDGAMSSSTIVQQNYTTSPGSPVPNVNYFLGDSNTDGTIRFGIYDGSYRQTAGITPTLNTWMHLVGTYDGNNFRMYKDGVLVSTSIAFTGGLGSGINVAGTLIGRRGSSADFFNGAIGLIRIYNKALSTTDVSQNFNATRNRFLTINSDLLIPNQKYGATTTETYTATSGYGSDTISYVTGNKPGVVFTTSGANTTLKLTETLTAATHYDTITVTDSLGASTYLPIKMTVSKADTLTISMDTTTVVTYNGAPITSYPKPVFKGLAGVDTLTVTTKFSSSLYSKSPTVPTNSDTYTVVGEDPVFGVGALSNYLNVIYETSTAVVNKAKQPALSVFLYGGTVGSAFPITVIGGGGDGAISETVTAGGTMTGCSISNHILTASSSSQGFCRVYIVKALSQNYLAESVTVDMYFMAYLNNQPTGQVGSGATIAINGATSLTVDDTSTVRAPNVTSLSVSSGSVGSTIHIYGGNFGAGPLTIKFYRNKIATGTVISGSDITVAVPVGASTGPILVITVNGEATTPTFTVLP